MEEFTEYQGQLNSHKKPHGLGRMRWKLNGDTYTGEFKSGLPHGSGTLFYATLQYTYTGEFSLGKRHGIGYLLLPSQDLFSGNFINDRLEGFAVIFYSNGDFYEGFTSQDKKHGEGVMRYHTGEVYYGSWWQNHKHGPGKLIMPDGVQSYNGMWVQGSFTGRGKVVKYQEGNSVLSVYEGQFLNGEISGEGVLTDSVGIYYKGQFLNGKMHGAGELLMPNGARYVGQFLYNHFKRGKGEQPDKSVAYGNFYNLSPDGIKVKMEYSDGAEYVGGMKEGTKTGFGMFRNDAGLSSLGRYRDGAINGDARVVYPDGREHYTNFQKGKETGRGITIFHQSPRPTRKFF